MLAILFYRHEAQSWHTAFNSQKSEMVAKSAEATAKQLAAVQTVEAQSRKQAQVIDTKYQQALNAAKGAADSLPRAPSVMRPYHEDTVSRPYPTAQGGGPSIPAPASTEANMAPMNQDMVAMSRADAETCATDYTYAQSAFEWTQALDSQ
jgi:hypothetical protein